MLTDAPASALLALVALPTVRTNASSAALLIARAPVRRNEIPGLHLANLRVAFRFRGWLFLPFAIAVLHRFTVRTDAGDGPRLLAGACQPCQRVARPRLLFGLGHRNQFLLRETVQNSVKYSNFLVNYHATGRATR